MIDAATQPHSHTATQPHSHTATQPHSHTATQPHSHTATQPHSHTLDHYLATSLRRLLLIIEYVSVVVFVLSFRCHRQLYLQVTDWGSTEAYFIRFLEEPANNNSLSIAYHSYRYDGVS